MDTPPTKERPMSTQFPQGRSGNRRGRPASSRNRKKIVEDIANEKHHIVHDGKRRKVPTLDLVLRLIRNRAMEGDPKARRAYEALLDRYTSEAPQKGGGYLIVSAPVSQDEWERLAREHGKKGRGEID
jgi:hypothetical protein